ncbi:hypothetical protein M3Y99_01550600 [Aphelenchoides fujianensis]|nr:hypothetical protein M3Y99_01550600 [Aphelenchoides fujianensis]
MIHTLSLTCPPARLRLGLDICIMRCVRSPHSANRRNFRRTVSLSARPQKPPAARSRSAEVGGLIGGVRPPVAGRPRFASAFIHAARGSTQMGSPAADWNASWPPTPTDSPLPGADPTMEKIFVASIVTLATVGMTIMGCDLELQVVWSTLKRPTAPIIGFFTQFFWMPLLAYALAKMMLTPYKEYPFALGLFITGCSPGGGASNFWTYLLGGNTHLSITMTFLSTLASFGTIMFWMKILGYQFLEGIAPHADVQVPYRNIASSLSGIVIPLLVGVAIARYRPHWATQMRKILKPFSIFFVVFAILFGFLRLSAYLQLLDVVGGRFWRPSGVVRVHVRLLHGPPDAAEAGGRDGDRGGDGRSKYGGCHRLSFDAHTADIAMLVPMIFACSIPGPLLLGYAVHHTVQKMRESRLQKQQLTEVQVELSPSSHSKLDTHAEPNGTAPRASSPSFLRVSRCLSGRIEINV